MMFYQAANDFGEISLPCSYPKRGLIRLQVWHSIPVSYKIEAVSKVRECERTYRAMITQ